MHGLYDVIRGSGKTKGQDITLALILNFKINYA